MSEKKQGSLSRRQFLVGAGTFTAGALTAGGVLGGLDSAEAAAQALPWPYVTLDPAAVMEAGYNNYFTGGCCWAVGKALVDDLATNAGAPWDTINPEMFKFGAGGVAGWGALCGTLNGALTIIGMIAGADASTIGNELMGFYTTASFPTTALDAVATYQNQPQTVANSPLCHNSSAIWSYTSGFKISSYERKDRCAKVAGEVAAKTVEYLNAWKAGTFTATFQHDPSYARCFDCHVGSTSKKDNVQGTMNCLANGCHEDKATHQLK